MPVVLCTNVTNLAVEGYQLRHPRDCVPTLKKSKYEQEAYAASWSLEERLEDGYLAFCRVEGDASGAPFQQPLYWEFASFHASKRDCHVLVSLMPPGAPMSPFVASMFERLQKAASSDGCLYSLRQIDFSLLHPMTRQLLPTLFSPMQG